MKKIFLFLFFLLIGVFLFFRIIKEIGWQEIKLAFFIFFSKKGLVILGLTILIWLTGLLRWKEILRGQGENLSFLTLFRPYFSSLSLMFFFPMLILAGEFFRAYFLKEKKSILWQKGMASVLIDRILEITVYLIIIFLGIFFFLFKIGFLPKNLGAILVILIIIALFILFFYFKSFKKESILKIFGKLDKKNKIRELEKEIFEFFKIKNKFLWRGFFLSFLKSFFNFLRIWILILFLGKTTGIFSLFSILGFLYFTLMIPIPASLGSQEAFQAFAFLNLGIGASRGAAFSMLIRTAELIVALMGMIILVFSGLKFLKKFLN
jgi:uncharacterized protein (TIRG00374 family)